MYIIKDNEYPCYLNEKHKYDSLDNAIIFATLSEAENVYKKPIQDIVSIIINDEGKRVLDNIIKSYVC